jgi:hypothetical protein
MEHRIVMANEVEPIGQAEVRCECGWTGTAGTIDEAEKLADAHLAESASS